MTLILLAISAIITACFLAWHLAIYALPFMVGLTAFQWVHANEAGIPMSALAALGAALASVVLVIAVVGLARNLALRLIALAVFAVPAFTAGYFHQCAIEMNCAQLARAGRFLIGAPQTALISTDNVRHINALMMTCGHYNGSGEFAYRVGLPGKSGVGGGILIVVPGCASIAVWSPGLNEQGNSALGTAAAVQLARRMEWSVFV